MTVNTSRRELLKAAPLTAAAAVIPTAALAIATADRAAWTAALAQLSQAKAEDEAFSPGYFQTWQKRRAEYEAVPHVALRTDPHTGRLDPVTTADQWNVRSARRDVAALDAGKMRYDPLPGLHEHFELQRDLVKAADERDAAIQAIRDRYDMDRLDERSEELGDALSDAEAALMNTPAPDLAALRLKLERLPEKDGDMPAWSSSYIAQTFADVARLLPKGA
jgi:hypothetical protein